MSGFRSSWLVRCALLGSTLVVAACGSGDAEVTYWSNGAGQNRAVESYAGAEHCGWQDLTFLHIAWPLPGQTGPAANRQYVRDPAGRLAGEVLATYAPRADLPADARTTDYTGPDGQQLWLAPSDSDKLAYVVYPDSQRVEAWPRTTKTLGCD
ncbi:hypothetical protein [Micromonospora chokoriensis]|uniref:hypothetical protein n=1 Tax=Micromonospora chokoriensis TaxID=356851 RepID=UPI0012FCA960|nr:hypothetical protein [Micromonospora chokoriensis]